MAVKCRNVAQYRKSGWGGGQKNSMKWMRKARRRQILTALMMAEAIQHYLACFMGITLYIMQISEHEQAWTLALIHQK